MSIGLTLLVLALLVALMALWPFGPYQLSLALAARLCRFPALESARPPDAGLTFAVCLCAYNEAGVIREKVCDLLRMRAAAGGRLEILVYVDAATDGTAELLRPFADQIRLHVSPVRCGKTHGMNLLVGQTRAEVVIFTDANVLIVPEAVDVLRRYFADPAIGCVCSDLHYVNAEASPTSRVGAAYWRFNEWSKALETRTGSVIGADGSCFAIRRRLHRPVPAGLFDDLFVSLSVLLAGFRVVRAPELAAFETHTTEGRDEFRRKIRIACECLHVHFQLWPELRRLDGWNLYKYLSHRFVRWIDGYLLALAALLAAAAIGTLAGPLTLALLAGGGGLIFWGGCRLGLRPALLAWHALLAFAGNAIGVWRALRGERAVVWEVPTSSRQVALER